jgi:integrase
MHNFIKRSCEISVMKSFNKGAPLADSSNDALFNRPRARNAPIKSSMTTVEGLPEKLKLYRIAGSKYWQMRFYNLGRYSIQSLKTTDLAEAKFFATQIFDSWVASGTYVPSAPQLVMPLASNQLLLHDLIDEVLLAEEDKVKRDEIKPASYVMTKIRLEGLIFDYFKSRPLHKINADVLAEFISYLTQQNFAASTIQGYMAQTRKLLKLLCRKQIIKAVPAFPTMKAQPHSRGAFTITEYKAILRQSKQLRSVTFTDWGVRNKAWIKSDYHQMPHEMNWLIRFMVYTFVRPGDIRQIKNKHIEIIRGAYHYLRLNLPEVKRHTAATVSLSPAVFIFEKLLSYQAARGYGRPDDYVFFPEESNRRLVLDITGWAFNWILKTLGIKAGPHGTDRTLYSLRHTAITFRLIYGGNIDLLTLARNARTSVEMIDKFYASTLSAEMNIALLLGKRGK